jgi:uncharacterized integral membrane protein
MNWIKITAYISLYCSAIWFLIQFIFAFWNNEGISCININLFNEKYFELPLILWGIVFGAYFLFKEIKEEMKK